MTVDFDATVEPGFRLDHYELLCPIAQGGMGQIWLARPEDSATRSRLVAVKTILPRYALDLQFQKMFLDEARIATAIMHKNVAQIFDLGEHGDTLYLVMDWVDGESLSQLFRATQRRGLSVPSAIVARVVADACAGLHAAHTLRDKSGVPLHVVHRDVSPQNILVSIDGDVKLIDFGIAKARARASQDGGLGMFKGKVLYMAPEQALSDDVDQRADVWAAGAVLYHLLAGVPAFEGISQADTLRRLTDESAAFAPLPDAIPAGLRDVIARALVRDPDRRTGTAEELGAAIERAMARDGLRATRADVAAFMREQLTERNLARRDAIALALRAAAQRERGDVARALAVRAVSESEPGGTTTATSLMPPMVTPFLVARWPAGTRATVLGVIACLVVGVVTMAVQCGRG